MKRQLPPPEVVLAWRSSRHPDCLTRLRSLGCYLGIRRMEWDTLDELTEQIVARLPADLGSHAEVRVSKIPPCQLHPEHGPAYADAHVSGGRWGKICLTCFVTYGCSLGLGRGQKLIQA